MPAPIIAALIGAGVSGTEMGLSASGALTPSPAAPNSILQQPGAPQSPGTQNAIAAIRAANPYAQEQSQGSLSNPSEAELIASLAGSPADIGLVQQTIFGNAGPTYGTGSGLASNVG